MRYAGLNDFIAKGGKVLAKGPIALIFAEDEAEVDTTIRHHQKAGFRAVVVFSLPDLDLPADLDATIHRVDYDLHQNDAVTGAINSVIDAAAGQWLFYCFNAEYLFHPFCEDRNVRELIAFHTEERRDALLSYVIDLYAEDLSKHPNAVSLETAHLDRSGYYALAREDAANNWAHKERQLDFYGGLKWRFEEHVPWDRRKIDRICLFRAKAGLRLQPDFTLSDEEMNTYACQWHNNLTTALVSFRSAKALRSNPGSRYAIHDFRWRNSVRFDWHSQQLMDLGLMEPGQWF